VGEIADEFDLPETQILRLGRDRVRIEGGFPLEEFNERFGRRLPEDEYHTVGGFVFGELGRPAEPGDEVTHDGMVFRVDSVEGQRIDKLTVTFGWRHPREEPDD